VGAIELAILLAAAGYGAYRLVRAQAETRRYLEESREAPLELGHLSPELARVARETRTLRVALESTIRAVRAALSLDPTRTVDEIEALDAALMGATRDVGEWLAMIDGLAARELETLAELGVSQERIRAALEAEHGSFERARLRAAGRPTLDLRIEEIRRELGRIEELLVRGGSRIYR